MFISGLFTYTNQDTNSQICYFHFSFCAARKEKCIFPSSINLLFLKSEKELHSTDHEFSMPSSGNHATGSQMVLFVVSLYWLLDSHVNNNHIVRYSKENTSKVKLFSFGYLCLSNILPDLFTCRYMGSNVPNKLYHYHEENWL